MEELRSSRRPAKSSHGDVFGGVPKLSAAKSNDYAEIFGGVASSCSIPFLDLPPSNESDDRDGVIDYLEIFGGFKAGEFAVDYEELFSKKTTERVQMESKFSQPVGASELFPEGANQDYGACPEKSKSSSSSIHSDDSSKQFNMSYHRTSRGSIEDVIPGKTHITQLDVISGSTYTVNSCSLQDGGSNHFSNIQANDLIHIVSCNGQLNDAGQDKMSSLASSSDDIKSYGADLKSNEKEFSTNHATSENVPVHMKRHSHSSGNYSASSGDIPYPDVTYVSISDISLRTKPSRLPPPSRAPPKLISKQEDTKVKTNPRGDQDQSSLKPAWTPQIHYSVGSAKSHGLQGFAKENSSGFLDVEMDASSALAASAAAMKEAMEQAQARLKSAKELMDRKRDSLQSRKKMGHKETVKFDERKGVKSFEEGRMFSEVTAKKPLHKEDNEMKEHALDDVQKVIKVGKAALDDAEKEKYTVAAEESQQVRQGNGFVSSQVCHKSEEVSGEWRTEKQINELINNAKKFGTFKEAFKQEDFEKKSKMTSNLSENNFETVELGYEFNGAVKVRKISETIETQKINDNSKAHNAIHKEEIGKKPEKVTETCMSKESALEDSHSCHHQNCNKRFQTAQEALPRGEEQSKQNDVVEASCGENKLNVESSNDVKFEVFYHDDKDSNFLEVKEAFEHDDKEKQSGESYVISVPYEIDKKLKMSSGRGAQIENENDVRVATAACVREVEEDACLFENSEYAEGNGKVESCYEESECKLEDPEPINAYEENGACMTAENDLSDQDGNEVKNNSEELESAPDIIELQRTEERMNLAKESSCPDHNSMETTGTHHGHQQDEKKQSTEESPSVVKRTVEPGVLRHDHSEGENGNFKEDSKALGSEDMDSKFDATEGILETSDNKDIEDVQWVSKSEKKNLKDASQEVRQNFSLSNTAKETVMTGETENFNHEMRKREKLECMKTKEKERDHEKEQARKVEDEKERERGREKEREREREKDRLAMERATRESHERAARERVERIAVERATAEARQRALTEAREKAERAAAEALEKSLAEKALKEAKLRAERAAVERATAEARERAVEKALADKAAADARQRAERLNIISRDKIRKDNEAGEYSMASDKNDLEIKHKANSSDVPNNLRFQSAELSGSSQINSDSSAHGEVESPLRCKARLERHQRTVERAAKALLEKNLRDILAQRELAERNRLAESLDADVRRWSTGKEGNLRALLSTLQYILGPESGWQPIPLTDVITAVAVKKAYRKATLYVHPDKLQQRGASIQQKYICEKVFDLLKEAWNRFNSEER